MDTSILEDLGLTNAEIKVYLALLELGTATAGPILDKSGLQNSVVHMTLHKLLEKGFISYIIKGKTKHYQAADPRNISRFIEEKKNRFEKLLPELLVRQQKQERQQAEIFIGFKGFQNAYYELLKDAKKGDEYIFFAFEPNKDEIKKVYGFFYEIAMDRKKRGISTKGIAQPHLKEALKGRDPKELLFVDIPLPKNMSICNDKIVFNSWGDEQVTLLVQSRQLAESFRQYHESIWNKYKK